MQSGPSQVGGPRLHSLALAGALLQAIACGCAGVGASNLARSPLAPVAGDPGAGDPYFPDAGNGGTDAQRYELALDVDMVSRLVTAHAQIELVALEDLLSFDLDLVGMEVTAVTVDGRPATFGREGRELVILPSAPLAKGQRFEVEVEYAGTPEPAPDASLEGMGLPGVGWYHTDSGVYVVSECVGAASWFPCNDHPADKAYFGLTVTTDADWTVAANGIGAVVAEGNGKRTVRFEARDPMATYLATLCIAKFQVHRSEGPNGLPLTLYAPTDATEKELSAFARTGEILSTFEGLFGPYPFECAGGILSYEQLGGALETQTIPVYSRGSDEITVAHELAHQWFGDSVAIERWEDLWLNEGFASYAEWLWREHAEGPEALQKSFDRCLAGMSRRKVGAPFDPGVRALWSPRAYQRGALVLHALRTELGDERFFSLLKTWCERYRNANATTAEFIALAEEVGGRELDALFDTWLFGAEVPAPAGGEAVESTGAGGDEGAGG